MIKLALSNACKVLIGFAALALVLDCHEQLGAVKGAIDGEFIMFPLILSVCMCIQDGLEDPRLPILSAMSSKCIRIHEARRAEHLALQVCEL